MNPEVFNLQPQSLEDEWVQLVPLAESDFDRLFAVASDPLIWEQHPEKDRYRETTFRNYFEGGIKSKGAFLVLNRRSGEVIGSTRYYDYKPEQSSVAIGYTFLSRKYWGGVYNRSMKKLMIDHAFRFVDSILFHVGENNIRSQKAVLKLGAEKIGELASGSNGRSHTSFEYCLKKPDWLKSE